ncbi:PKD domain-containing protein [Taibaiella soli]|uniref:PKD domain-containing protein n=1 Tax=Taibaiella soli TaxID=1649169 RepID=A0A2W2BKH4_9BACT|nr:PKD domain-containing protein [Taibaiella soli]PZF73966.1 hypothetical protein DN068_06410 [Taibaiella soli]
MKKVLFSLSGGRILKATALFASLFLLALQSTGQLVSNYSFSQSSGTYTPITGGTVVVSNSEPYPGGDDSAAMDDFIYHPITLPFSFYFNGGTYTQATICTNGWIAFGSGTFLGSTPISGSDPDFSGIIAALGVDLMGPSGATGTFTNGSATITNVSNTTSCVAGAKIQGNDVPAGATISSFTANTITMSAAATSSGTGDFFSFTSGEIRTATTGTSPNRTFIIQFKNMGIYANSSTAPNNVGLNFQIQLSEGGGNTANQTVSVVYGSSFISNSSTRTAQVGLRGASSSDYNNRTSTWALSTAGGSNNSTISLSSSSIPVSGLTYTWNPPPACNGTPAAGTASANTATACIGSPFTLSTAGATATPGIVFQWQSSPTGAGTFTDITGANTANYTVTNQTAATDYRLKVTCTNGGASVNSNTVTVAQSAPPTVATLPYYQSFESWTTSCYTNQLPGNSWIVSPGTGDNSWRRDDQGSSANWSSTAGDYTPASKYGAHSARFHSFNTPALDSGTMDLYINLSPAGTKEISFYYINQDGDDSLVVSLSTNGGSSWTNLGTLKAAVDWTYALFATTSTSANAIIRFKGVSDYGGTDIGMDSLTVRVPTCVAPNTLTATSAVTGSSATLGWTQTGTPAQWQIAYGTNGFFVGTPVMQYASSTTATLSNLSPGASYYYYVRAICGSGDTSSWAGPYYFTMNCPTAATLPYIQTFDNYLPGCWTEAQGYLGTGTTLSGNYTAWYPSYYLNDVSVNNPAVDINLYSTGTNDWLISPSIDLGSGGNAVISFNFGVVEYADIIPAQLGSDDSVAIVVSTNNGATWSKANIVKLFTAANTPVNNTTGGARFTVPLTGYTGVVKIGIYATEGAINDPADNEIFVDSLLITSCNLSAIHLGNDTSFCQGNIMTLFANAPGATYHWNNNSTGDTLLVNATGIYYVTASAQGCAVSDTITITVDPLPTITAINTSGSSPAISFTANVQNATSYAWTFGDNTSATTASPTHTYTANGTYTVQLIATNDCGSDTLTKTLTISGLGVSNVIAEKDLNIYPNPANNVVTIENSSTAQLQTLSVINNVGMVVAQQQLNSKKELVKLSSLAAGIYTFLIQTDKGFVTRKIVVIR